MAEHKHAEVLRAIADGKVVQWQSRADGSWNDRQSLVNPLCEDFLNWRVKPEPKPDVVRYLPAYKNTGYVSFEKSASIHGEAIGHVRLTIDGETGKLKSVEIVE